MQQTGIKDLQGQGQEGDPQEIVQKTKIILYWLTGIYSRYGKA